MTGVQTCALPIYEMGRIFWLVVCLWVGDALFPRLDIDKELDELQRIKEEADEPAEKDGDAASDAESGSHVS